MAIAVFIFVILIAFVIVFIGLETFLKYLFKRRVERVVKQILYDNADYEIINPPEERKVQLIFKGKVYVI